MKWPGHKLRKKHLLFRTAGASADAPAVHFHGWGRGGERQLQRLLPAEARRCGESFCLSQACRDAPLGQRQGGGFRLPPPYLWTPPTPQRNNCDRRQRRKQGAVVGAAASKTRVPPKARSGCWVPQPVVKGCTPLTILKKKSKHKKASAAPVGAIALTLFSLLHLKPLSRCATAPPRGSWHARKLYTSAGNLPAMPNAPSQRELAKPTGFDGGSSLII